VATARPISRSALLPKLMLLEAIARREGWQCFRRNRGPFHVIEVLARMSRWSKSCRPSSRANTSPQFAPTRSPASMVAAALATPPARRIEKSPATDCQWRAPCHRDERFAHEGNPKLNERLVARDRLPVAYKRSSHKANTSRARLRCGKALWGLRGGTTYAPGVM